MATETRKTVSVPEQIAEKLNLSVSTVYAILADRKSCFASQKLKQKVKKLAQELGYRPNYIAVSLKTGKIGTIGFVVSDMHIETTIYRLESITQHALGDRYNVFIGISYDNEAMEEELLQEFYYRRVDGIAIVPARNSHENNFLRRLVEMKFPLMSFAPIENLDIDYVSVDYFSGGYMAGKHLLDMGYTKPGFLSPVMDTISIQQRFEGFSKALADNGCRLDESRVIFISEEKLLETDIDAVFGFNDRAALIFMKKALEKGKKKIPQDLGVIGFDDTEAGRLSLIPLTSVKQKLPETTAHLYSMLRKKMQGDNQSCRLLIEPELIARESTKRR